jgi:hypothetical protein
LKIGAKKSAGAVLILTVALAAAWSPIAYGAFPGANGKIAVEASGDIWVTNPDGSDRVNVTDTASQYEHAPHWSPDGRTLLFTRDGRPSTMPADGTLATPLPIPGGDDTAWSPDGQKVVFTRFDSAAQCEGIYTGNLNGTDETTVLAPDAGPCYKSNPAWSPAGGMLAFDGDIPPLSGFPRSGIFTVRLDGSNLAGPLDEGLDPDWSPAGHRILYTASITYPATYHRHDELYTMQPDGSAKVRLNARPGDETELGAWSPDGKEIVFNDENEPGGTWTVDGGGGNAARISTGSEFQPDWQPLPPLPAADPGYPRPRGATPFSVPLVPAYRECTNPNSEHGAPLAFGSCAPQQASDALTIGTPDANGADASSVGRVTLRAITGDSTTPADEADIRVDATLTDVRCRIAMTGYCAGGAMSDYLGRLELAPVIRITDRASGGAERDPATGFDVISFSMPMPCSETPADPEGSTCGTQTSFDALAPETIKEGKRAVWELGQMVVRDGGIDYPQVDAYTTFAVQGLFVP